MVAFSPSDPAFLENPFPFYKMGQAMSPLYMPNPGMWLVFGYDDCVTILKDHKTWSSLRGNLATDPNPQPTMLSSDEPRHGRLRGLVSQAFTPRMIEQLEPRIRQLAEELLDEHLPSGAFDLVEHLAYPLPVIVIAEILGIPPADRDQFKHWSDEIVATLGTGLSGQERGLPESTFNTIREYFTRMVEERRANPKPDLISGLVAAELEGDRLTFDELLQMLILLLVAGNETTTNLIGNAALEFIAHPAELQRVRDDMALLPSALEEVLRINSPVQATVRRATRDLEFAGKQIAAEQHAVVWLAAANRDPAAFPDPERFDVTRTPNRHISFGLGVHFCLGAPLARMEARIALEAFLSRTKSFARLDESPLPRVPTFIMRGVRSLPLEVTL